MKFSNFDIVPKFLSKVIYQQIEPSSELSFIVKNFWLVDSQGDATIKREKIIPDGYPEMIFHYGQKYKANISGAWFDQEWDLIAGQIRNFFYLENTGVSGMLGIKFQPWALSALYDLNMADLTDRVVGIPAGIMPSVDPLKSVAIMDKSFADRVHEIEAILLASLSSKAVSQGKGHKAVRLIIDSEGTLPLADVCGQVSISERSLERFFKSKVGVTPKFYSRIIRFSNIFKLLTTEDFNWSNIAYLSGYYDQSHFIKNFKEFTGEEPSRYGFSNDNMANFFLKPK